MRRQLLILIGTITMVIGALAFFVNSPSDQAIELEKSIKMARNSLHRLEDLRSGQSPRERLHPSEVRQDLEAVYRNNRNMSLAVVIVGFVLTTAGIVSPRGREEEKPQRTKKCPYCAETIKYEARVCRYCGRELVASEISPSDILPTNSIASAGKNILLPGMMVGSAAIVLLLVYFGTRETAPQNAGVTENRTALDNSHNLSYRSDIKPILDANCVSCHVPGGAGYEQTGLQLDSYDAIMKGTNLGPVVIPGSAVSSTLYRVLDMPEEIEGKPHNQLDEKTIATIKHWIESHAKE